jgi:hypothetical protein
MPSITQVLEWKRRYPEFATLYAEAQVERGLFYGDRIGELAEQVLSGEVDPAAARVAMDGYKFTAARLASKTWGEKSQVTVEHGVSAQAAEVLRELSGRARQRQIEAQCIDVTPARVIEDSQSLQHDSSLMQCSASVSDNLRLSDMLGDSAATSADAGLEPPAPGSIVDPPLPETPLLSPHPSEKNKVSSPRSTRKPRKK